MNVYDKILLEKCTNDMIYSFLTIFFYENIYCKINIIFVASIYMIVFI